MKRAGVLCGVVCLMAAVARAQAPTGPETELFSTAETGSDATTLYATDTAVAPDGAMLVVGSAVRPGSVVEARLFDQFGQLLGGPFIVGSHPAGNWAPSVARINGGYVVVWESLDPTTPIYGRLLDASGAPVGSEFRVSEALPDPVATTGPIVRAAPDGRFVVAWNGKRGSPPGANVFARLYSAAGVAQGPAIRVNRLDTADDQSGSAFENRPGLGVAGDSSFVVAWRALPSISPAPRIFVDRFDPNGVHLGEGLVSPFAGAQPSVAVAPDGTFLVAFTCCPSDFFSAIYARAFASSGTPVASEVPVSVSHDTRFAARPRAVATGESTFTVMWEGWSSGAHPTAFGRTVLPTGVPAGPIFRVGNHDARLLSAASDGQGGLAAVWQAWGGIGLPFNGVVMRRYAALAPAGALSVADPAAGTQSDGNGILDPGETVGFRSAWSNLDGGAINLSGQAIAFGGPAASYAITDDDAAYGVIAGRTSASCIAGGSCFGLSVDRPAQRPAAHWDALLDERLVTGQLQRWHVHIGETFVDVPRTSPFYRYVEALVHNGVTGGCSAEHFCPGNAVTRAQVALFLLVAAEGPHYISDRPVTTPAFSDVPRSSPFFAFIEELFARGVVGGCGGGAYCPQGPVTRSQVATMTLLTFDPAFTPPACTTPAFADVPASSSFCPWVEEMARRGVMGGCGGGRFCPDDPVTREQLALILSRTFGLTATGF